MGIGGSEGGSKGGSKFSSTPLSYDHKPSLPSERARIEAAGGSVTLVEGTTSTYEVSAPGTELRLRMSRSFGDYYLKSIEGVHPHQQPVIAIPEIVYLPRDYNQEAFIILACDGVWDVMTNQEAVELIAKCLFKDKQSPAQACDALLAECLERGSEDNMSAMVIKLNPPTTMDTISNDTPVNLLNVSSISSVMRSATQNSGESDIPTDSVDSCRKNLTLEFE